MDISRKVWDESFCLLFKNKKSKNLLHSFLNKQDLEEEREHTQQQKIYSDFQSNVNAFKYSWRGKAWLEMTHSL